jgi:hypothetical protein
VVYDQKFTCHIKRARSTLFDRADPTQLKGTTSGSGTHAEILDMSNANLIAHVVSTTIKCVCMENDEGISNPLSTPDFVHQTYTNGVAVDDERLPQYV